jgi:hypothetical protein
MMAVDSLNKEGSVVEINIYDTKATNQPLSQLLHSRELNNVGLIIAAISNTQSSRLLLIFLPAKTYRLFGYLS